MADQTLWTVNRTNSDNAELMTEIDDVKAVVAVISMPVPVNIITDDYSLSADDQRTAYLSAVNGVATLPEPFHYYARRSVALVIGAGQLTLQTVFLDETPSGTLENPVLKKGQVLEFLGLFIPDVNGTDDAPSGLKENGLTMADSRKGFYRLQIVNSHKKAVDYEEYVNAIAGLREDLENAGIDVDLTLLFENNLE